MTRRRKWIIAWVLTGLAVAVALAYAYSRFLGSWKEQHEVHESLQVMTALIYYVESHEGRMPAEWDDLVKAGIARRYGPNRQSLEVFARPRSKFRPSRFSEFIEDVTSYRVLFGLSPDDITVTDEGVFDRQGRAVKLLSRMGASEPTGLPAGWYRWECRTIADAMKETAAERKEAGQ